jgi:hypothetical protein
VEKKEAITLQIVNEFIVDMTYVKCKLNRCLKVKNGRTKLQVGNKVTVDMNKYEKFKLNTVDVKTETKQP